MVVLQKVKIELPYDPAIPLLGIGKKKKIDSRVLRKYLHTHVHGSNYSQQQKGDSNPSVHQQTNV